MILSRQFAPIIKHRIEFDRQSPFGIYDRKVSVGTVNSYEERYSPGKKFGLKSHAPHSTGLKT